MRGCSKQVLESSRPNTDRLDCINFCLEQLYKDKKKCLDDYVAGCCTYEELIGTLLLCRDLVKEEEGGE